MPAAVVSVAAGGRVEAWAGWGVAAPPQPAAHVTATSAAVIRIIMPIGRRRRPNGSEGGSAVEGMKVELRVRLSAADAHYGGNLVDGAHGLELFGDIVTELAVRTDGDEGLFAGYEKVEFLAPLYGGDFVRATGAIVRMGTTSRTVDLEIWKEIAARPDVNESAADVLDPPVLATRARGTYVVKREHHRGPGGHG